MKDVSGNALAPVMNTGPFRIGLAGTTSGGSYSIGGGTIDEVAAFGRVLPQQTIQDHYDFGRGAT